MVETISILLFIRTKLLPMNPDSILKDGINRANKAKQEKNKSENQIVAKEFEQQIKPNNKPSSVF